MLDRVKQKIELAKEPLVPISLRIENSSKTAISLLAVNYGIKTNELIRYILQAFIEEAWNEELDAVKINTYFESEKMKDGYLAITLDQDRTLGKFIEDVHPEFLGQENLLHKMGFFSTVKNEDLGDQ